MLSCHIDPFLAFLHDLQIEGCEVHLYRGPNTFGGLLTEGNAQQIVESMEQENIYFLPGVRPGLRKRAADNDVMRRGMFTFDFDIRKELDKTLTAITEDDIAAMAQKIIAALTLHPIWGKIRYGAHSGNGLHIHCFGEPVEVSKEKWSEGMKDVFSEVAKLTPIPPDFGCGNAGRIMRIPGSWNVKEVGKKKPVRFLIWNPEVSLPPLSFVQERGALAIKRHNQRREEEKREFEQKHSEGGENMIDLINQIPIEQVVFQLLGCRVSMSKKDGGMRFVDDKGVERGFFKHQRYNIIVHEGTSLFPPPTRVGYNCFGLVKVVLGMHTREVVEWFCDRSSRIRDLQDRQRKNWQDNRIQTLANTLLIQTYGQR